MSSHTLIKRSISIIISARNRKPRDYFGPNPRSRKRDVRMTVPAELFRELRAELDRAVRDGRAGEDVLRAISPSLRAQGLWLDDYFAVNPKTRRRNKFRPMQDWFLPIYSSYLRVRMSALHLEQMRAVSHSRPWWEYVCPAPSGEGCEPSHGRWNGLILRHDDEWWKVHFPPNCAECCCELNSLSDDDLKFERLVASGRAPKAEMVRWRSPFNDRVVELPAGVAPGFLGMPSVAMADRLLQTMIDRSSPSASLSWAD